LRKERSGIEVYNDLDREVFNFFQVLRDRPNTLIRLINFTPFACAEYELAQEPANDPVESARRFYVRSYLSIAGPTAQWNTGWRRQKHMSRGRSGKQCMTPAAISFMKTEHLYQVAERLRGVYLEQKPALELMDIYDAPITCFYVDPPYVASTRGRWKDAAYAHEMDDDDHAQLLSHLQELTAAVVLSGYNCDLYRERLGDWWSVERPARINGPGEAIETLWLNAAAAAGLRYGDLPLFADAT
jgi:DNA adenine methylase